MKLDQVNWVICLLFFATNVRPDLSCFRPPWRILAQVCQIMRLPLIERTSGKKIHLARTTGNAMPLKRTGGRFIRPPVLCRYLDRSFMVMADRRWQPVDRIGLRTSGQKPEHSGVHSYSGSGSLSCHRNSDRTSGRIPCHRDYWDPPG